MVYKCIFYCMPVNVFCWDPCGLSVICWIIKDRIDLFSCPIQRRWKGSLYRNIDLFLEVERLLQLDIDYWLELSKSLRIWRTLRWRPFSSLGHDYHPFDLASISECRTEKGGTDVKFVGTPSKDTRTLVAEWLLTEDWYWIVRSFTGHKRLKMRF